MEENCEFVQKGGDQEIPVIMVDVFAVVFETGMNFLFGEVQGVGPGYVSAFEDCQGGVFTIVVLFEVTVVQAGVKHESKIGEVEGVCDRMLCEENLLTEFAELLCYFVEVDDAVVD